MSIYKLRITWTSDGEVCLIAIFEGKVCVATTVPLLANMADCLAALNAMAAQNHLPEHERLGLEIQLMEILQTEERRRIALTNPPAPAFIDMETALRAACIACGQPAK